MKSRIIFSRKTDNWETPEHILEQYGPFDLDPCPINPVRDGLSIDWRGRVFVNPPFSEIPKWVSKAILDADYCEKIVLLLPSRTDTKWFHKLLEDHRFKITFLKGRLKFSGHIHNAPFPCLIAVKN